MKYFWTALAWFKNNLYLEYRYPLQVIMNAIGFLLFTYLLSIGAGVSNPNISKAANLATVFTAFIAAFGLSMPLEILGKTKTSIQEVYLLPVSRLKYILSLSAFSLIQMMLTFLLYLGIISFLFKLDILIGMRFLPVAVPVFISSLGLGLFLLSFRIIFQKIGSLVNFVSMIFIGSAIAATTEMLRLTANYSVLARALLYIQTNEPSWFLLWLLAIITLAIGVVVFKFSERVMFQRALISLD